MCLPNQVMVYADCAMNPNPDAEALAYIARATADSAVQFGLSPVAMLSYATGSSDKEWRRIKSLPLRPKYVKATITC